MDPGLHFLFDRDGGGAADFGLSLSNALVGFGLRLLQFSADVFTDIDVSNVDRENLEGRADI